MKTAQDILSVIMKGLTPRETEVLTGRFGLDKSGRPQTLAALGLKYDVTRERVRQIETSALKAVQQNIKGAPEIAAFIEKAKKQLKDAGGVMKKDRLINALKTTMTGLTDRHLAVLIESSKAFFFYAEDSDYHDFYYLDKASLKKMQTFISQWSDALNAKKGHVLGGKYAALLSEFLSKKGIPQSYAEVSLELSKLIGINPYGDSGLAVWPEIRPKTIRDRVYLVLKKHGEPLHFRTIAKSINEVKFDAKKASAPTVHNELIKDARFVLVGRGMYALAEHGYADGTAREVIHRILSKHGPLTPRQVILAVQKERFFKPNTVLVNLQNKDFFLRMEDGTYHVRVS
jgi:Sigma-70, region 4